MVTDFFGVELDLDDEDQKEELIFTPVDDSMRTMHSLSCPHHGFEIDESGTITLIAEEVRAITFAVPIWYKSLGNLVLPTMAPELADILDDMRPYAFSNQDYEIPVTDARILYPCISTLQTAVTMRNAYLRAMFGDLPSEGE